jgi:hypothetical protein
MPTLDAELQAAYQALESAEAEWEGLSGRGPQPTGADVARTEVSSRLEALARHFCGLSERLGLLGVQPRIR